VIVKQGLIVYVCERSKTIYYEMIETVKLSQSSHNKLFRLND